MPRTGVYTSAEERQRLRQSYYATSEKEAGVAHLWHLQQLADIRFNPSHSIRDAPDVDFRSTVSPSDEYRDLFAQRSAQQVLHDDAKVYEQNKIIYRNIVLASDDEARRARHMNLVPTENQVKRFDNIDQQTLHRSQDRERRQRAVAAENRKLLDHLVTVPPHVRTAKELDAWYHNVHKKRLAQLSRFKPAERYAGERLLMTTAASRQPYLRSGSSSGDGERKPRDFGAAPPLVRGQPYPPPSMAESARTAPASLRPVTASTTYNGAPLTRARDATSAEGDVSARQPRRPEWQPLAATDIPLLHYAADRQLRRGGAATGDGATNPSTSRRLRESQEEEVWNGGGRGEQRHAGSSRSPSPAQRELFPAVQEDRLKRLSASYTTHGAPQRSRTASRHGGVRRVTAHEEGGVTQLWRHAVAEQHHGAQGKSVRAMTAYDSDEEGGEQTHNASTTSSRHLQQSSDSHAPHLSPSTGAAQGRSAKKPPRSSNNTTTATSAVRAASPAQRHVNGKGEVGSAGSGGPQREEEEAAVEEDEGNAGLKELMDGWTRRSETSKTAYAPI